MVLAEMVAGPRPGLRLLDLAATVALLVGLGLVVAALTRTVRQRLLWRVRRKLILSYVFIGLVPVLLIAAFFALAGVLVLLNVGSFLVRKGFDELIDEARVAATTTAAEIARGATALGALPVLERKVGALAERYPGVSLALVPLPRTGSAAAAPAAAGAWGHERPPAVLPAWMGPPGFGGLLVSRVSDAGGWKLVVRAVAMPEGRRPVFAVVVDLPVDEAVRTRLREATGIKVGDLAVVGLEAEPADGASRRGSAAAGEPAGRGPGPWSLAWVSFLDATEWNSGRPRTVSVDLEVYPVELYDRISGSNAPVGPFGSVSQIVWVTLAVVGVLFLVIEVGALAAGFALARSITGAVHELFAGTERVRRGELSQPIRVTSRDQLGELAASFNDMTRSIETLLAQAAEKKRLEEELRIARQIQESLLPREPVELPGAEIAAACVPAREVGGDYYDLFPLGARKLGLLVADVAGKGTSAALYMAELKGLVLSLSRVYESPKELLAQLNRLLVDQLDPRSFITMTYAVLDLDAGWLRYARAGHTPLLYLPGSSDDGAEARLLLPEGLVLGLRLDGVKGRFDEWLEEDRLPLRKGDVYILYTDGLTEAMNEAADLFGERRLCRVVEAHRGLSARQLRDRLLDEVAHFVGGAERHDDLTMVVVKIEGP